MSSRLTEEQQAVIKHPLGKHARVLAVAGSGKTTTMVYRIKHLVEVERVNPDQICILMFNRRAREQFQVKLNKVVLDSYRPKVNTFHSFAYSVISEAANRGILPAITDVWIDDRAEVARRTVHQAITGLAQKDGIPAEMIDPDDALESIGLWKGSLIPPERAGHLSNSFMPLVYEEFERLRIERNALTFDDFVPLAVGIIESDPAVASAMVRDYRVVIVDEYQDVNYGQQRLIELVAGQGSDVADIMVVGDDDQTIYEWRGARPNYIVNEFPRLFNSRQCADYKLSHTFRFGPMIAQCAYNTIRFNKNRIDKVLTAHHYRTASNIQLFFDTSEQNSDVNRDLALEVLNLVKQTQNPKEIVVLSRMFSQLTGLETEFLTHKIPYRVLGRPPFFERRELVVLLDYMQLAMRLETQSDEDSLNHLLSVINAPNRKISKDAIKNAVKARNRYVESVQRLLLYLIDPYASPLSSKQRRDMEEFVAVIERMHELLIQNPDMKAGSMLDWLIGRIDYLSHFDDYFGSGEASEDRKKSVGAFCHYAAKTAKSVPDFVEHIKSLDTTRGYPEDQQILMTTIYRVKGEEFDYVIIPNCEEGYMPLLLTTATQIFDKAGIVEEPPTSKAIENERRLFYVGITRAKKSVYISASSAPQKGSQGQTRSSVPSRFIEEMQLEPTSHIADAFRRAVYDKSKGLAYLENALRKYAERRDIVANFFNEYLPAAGLAVASAVIRHCQTVNPVEFQYSRDFPDSDQSIIPDKEQDQDEPKWWDK